MMPDHLVSRDALYARFESFAAGRAQGNAREAHDAVLDRLEANQRAAEAFGWTSCALERSGSVGPMRLWGHPPGDVERHPIPDWLPTFR